MTQALPPPGKAAPSNGEEPTKEYYFLEGLVQSANADCLEIKKWSVTAAAAVAVLGQVAGVPAYMEAAIIALMAGAFWLTEARTRMTQWAFIRRIQQIETEHPLGPQVSHSWARFYYGTIAHGARREAPRVPWDSPVGEGDRMRHHFWSASTMLPHVFVVAVSLAAGGSLFAYRQFGPQMPDKAQKEALSGDVTVHLLPGAGARTGPQPAPR